MTFVLLILAALFVIGAIWLHRSADKSEEQFRNRPAVITDPAKDLFTNQKYAVVRLFAFIQGASPLSAYGDEANRIVQDVFSSLGVSRAEAEKVIRISMRHDAEREFDSIMRSLSEIRDRNYLAALFRKAMRVARLSGDADTMDLTKNVFGQLGISDH